MGVRLLAEDGIPGLVALSAPGKDTVLTVNAVTHLNFRGDARAARGFYQSVFGEM